MNLPKAVFELEFGHGSIYVFLAITMLGERLHPLEMLGAVIVLSATLLIVKYDKV